MFWDTQATGVCGMIEYDEDGYETLRVKAADGTVFSQEVDLHEVELQAFSVINNAGGEDEDDDADDKVRYKALRDFFRGLLGHPGLSTRAAQQLLNMISDRIKELNQKKGDPDSPEGGPGSPGSTTSTPTS